MYVSCWILHVLGGLGSLIRGFLTPRIAFKTKRNYLNFIQNLNLQAEAKLRLFQFWSKATHERCRPLVIHMCLVIGENGHGCILLFY